MSKIFAIDPGSEKSAWVQFEVDALGDIRIEGFNVEANVCLLALLPYSLGDVVIEKIASFGMPVGADVFETVYWTGRFAQQALSHGCNVHRLERLKVKLQLCRDSRAKDANIRQALIDRFGGPAAIKKGGKLYKISSHTWQALAVGITFAETHGKTEAA